MKWYGHMCYSDVPLGVPNPLFDDPRYLAVNISNEIVEFSSGRYSLLDEKEILATALERFLHGKQVKLEKLREGSSHCLGWEETSPYYGIVRERGS